MFHAFSGLINSSNTILPQSKFATVSDINNNNDSVYEQGIGAEINYHNVHFLSI